MLTFSRIFYHFVINSLHKKTYRIFFFHFLQRVIHDPLPPTLAVQDEIIEGDLFKTTTGSAHDRKHLDGYGNRDPLYKKAPGHYKVGYVKDLHEKVNYMIWYVKDFTP